MAVTICTITGTLRNTGGAAVIGATVTATMDRPYIHPTDSSLVVPYEVTTTTDSSGNWSLALAETTTPGITITVSFTYAQGVLAGTLLQEYTILVPDATSALFSNLVGQENNFVNDQMQVGITTIDMSTGSGNTGLTVGSTGSQRFINNAFAGWSISLPDATTMIAGMAFNLFNRSTTTTIPVFDRASNLLQQMAPGSQMMVTCASIATQAGVWDLAYTIGAALPLPVASGGTGVATSTGTGNTVLSTSPTLVTPALGTPSALVGTNITGTAAGLTAGNVTTNANLTGVITSSGNATSTGSQTGTGNTFVMSAGPTLTGTLTAATITSGSSSTLSPYTLAGDPTNARQVVFGSSGRQGSVGTAYSTGTAYFAFNATQTTNATDSWTQSDTGQTSMLVQASKSNGFQVFGAASSSSPATLATFWGTNLFQITQAGVINVPGLTVSSALATDASKNLVSVTNTGSGNNVLATSPTLVSPALGTPASGVLTNCTGTASGLTAGNVTTNANLTGGVTSVGNATTVVTNANLTGGVTSVGNATTVVTNANLTGDVTSSGNATTVAKIAGVSVGTPTGTGNVVMSASPTVTGTLTAAAVTASGLVTIDNDITFGSGGATAGAAIINSNLVSAQAAAGSSGTPATFALTSGGVYILFIACSSLGNTCIATVGVNSTTINIMAQDAGNLFTTSTGSGFWLTYSSGTLTITNQTVTSRNFKIRANRIA